MSAFERFAHLFACLLISAACAIGCAPTETPADAAAEGDAAVDRTDGGNAVPSAPLGVVAQALVRAADVTWTVPESGGPFLGFVVTASPSGRRVTVDGTVTTARISDLENGAQYTFVVAASNAFGTGATSIPSAPITTPDVPGAATGVVAQAGVASARVHWSAPDSDGGSPITGYEVTASPGGAVSTVDAETLELVVVGLQPGMSHTFAVVAQNAVGAGPSVASNEVMPSAGAPSPPREVTAVAGAGQATVAFIPPAQDGGSPIVEYIATASPGGESASVAPGEAEIIVAGLTNGMTYTFTVSARNAVATGEPSTASNEVTPRTVPDAPTNVTVVPGDAQVSVSWTAPVSDGGSALTGYTILASPGDVAVEASGAAGSVTLPGLSNGTTYTVTVAAENAAGSGPAAMSAPFMPSRIPDAPSAVAATGGHGQATVTWAPPVSDGGSAVTGYVVTVWPGESQTSAAASTTTAVVTGLQDGTAYTFTVTALNDVGASAPSAASNTIITAAVPQAPTGVSAARGNGQALVSWSPPSSDGGAIITGYSVTGQPGDLFTMTSGAASSVTITGLSNGTTYTFNVTAHNAVGSGPASDPSNAVTPEAVPGQPTGVTAVSGNAQATISWIAPSDEGSSPLLGYTVTASPGGKTETVSSTDTSLILTELTNGTTYTFTVRAESLVGAGLDSQPSNAVTPATVPDAPTEVTATDGNAQAVVSWTAPASHGGSAITSYTVTSTPGGVSTSVGGATNTATLSGLSNGTSYTFTVTAHNSVGASVASSTSNAVTPATLPGAPTAVVAERGNAQASISWIAPVDDGGSPVTGYTVSHTPGGGTLTVQSSTTEAVVTGLVNGTAYTFTVTAQNAVGSSLSSAPSDPVTPATVPSVPRAVSATAGNAQATVNWTAPVSSGGSVITGYTVSASPGAISSDVASSASSATLSGLTNGVAYTFTVTAHNAVGSGATSSPSAAVIPSSGPAAPGAPSDVVATSGNNKVLVAWNAPVSDGGSAITGYTVSSSSGDFGATVAGSSTTATVLGPVNGTTYTFQVVAHNAVGASAASADSNPVVPAFVPDPPLSVTAMRGNAQATLSWLVPYSDGGSPITGYTIVATPGPVTATAAGNVTSAVITGLSNGTQYRFVMTAENALGSSLEAMALNGVSPSTGAAQRPAAPTGVGASGGDGQARVFWSAPANNGGSVITQFTVTASPGGATSTVTGFHRTGAVVTGLSNGVAYTFTVTATNAVGVGTASTASDPVTPSASDTGCPLVANTSVVGTTPSGCAILERDTSACEASRTAQGLSGFWLRFSCRVTLTKTTVSGQSVVQLSSDSFPDYLSKYFAASHACREEYPTAHTTPGSLLASSYTMNVPLTPTSSGAQTQGSIGLAVNGVFLFDNEAAPGDDIYEEAAGFDRCSGHPNSTGYHYHSEPWSISYDDDAFIGVLRDGYPLYGRRDPDGTYPALDSNGGHTGTTLDSPAVATYHYHVNAQTSTTTGSAGHVRWFLTGGRYRGTSGLCSGC